MKHMPFLRRSCAIRRLYTFICALVASSLVLAAATPDPAAFAEFDRSVAASTQASPSIPNHPVAQHASKRLWNLQDADILSVINEVSQETGKNFVVDPRVTGKITLDFQQTIEAI